MAGKQHSLLHGRLMYNFLCLIYRSIEELQEQNQRLLEAIRDLSDKREQEEKMALDTRLVIIWYKDCHKCQAKL